jgi:hypothetical protein
MLRPERAWVVGDKFFPTYEEARTYLASRRGELSRELLIDVIDEIQGELLAGGHLSEFGSGHVAEEIADGILKKFKLTLRK